MLSTSFVNANERRQPGAHHASKNHKFHIFLLDVVLCNCSLTKIKNVLSYPLVYLRATNSQFYWKFYCRLCVLSACRKISPIFEKLSKAHDSISFVKIDIDQFPEIANEYTVKSVPTFLFLSGRKTVSEVFS